MDLFPRKAALIMSVFLLGVLGGCDHSLYDDEIRARVRARVNDPDSVQFGKTLVSEKLKGLACVEYNAKDPAGRYLGFRTALLTRVTVSNTERLWGVESMDLRFVCTEAGLHKYVDALRSAIKILDQK